MKMAFEVTGKAGLVSIVLSFRNEEEVLPELIRRLRETLKALPIEYEVIFVNDGSTDNSLSVLIQEGSHDNRIRIINMSRRFGVSECVLAGMRYARGDGVIYMDADLQDPPEVIPELIQKWLSGADVVYTVRVSREGESALKMLLTKAAYQIIGFAAEIDLKVETGDFKLVSRRVVNELLKLKEKSPYLRGLVEWVGFKQVPVFYHRQRRAGGRTHFPLWRNFFRDLVTLHGPVGTFIRGLTGFSVVPLAVFLVVGLVLCVGAFVAVFGVVVMKYTGARLPEAAVILAVTFLLSGIQLLGIGTLGLYLGRIYDQVKGRPDYIVESVVQFDEDGVSVEVGKDKNGYKEP